MRILVIGEACRDVFTYGKAARLSPECPTPVFLPQSEVLNAGMAGNVAANIVALGGDVRCDLLSNESARRAEQAIIKHRFVDAESGYTLLRVDTGDSVSQLHELEFNDFCQRNTSLGGFGAFVISDYAKGFLTEQMIAYIVGVGNQEGIPTFLDTKKILGAWSKDVFVVKINSAEYDRNVKANPQIATNPTEYCQNLIVTRGKDGADWVNKGVCTPAVPVDIQNLCGAGDVYLAALVVSYLGSRSLEVAMRDASYAASYSVTKRGVPTINRDELVKFIKKAQGDPQIHLGEELGVRHI